MDFVVHGTKGGRQIFTAKKLGGLLDVNSDVCQATAIGQEAYGIRFVESAIIFSKYRIIRDVRGDKRIGFLAFSLFLPNDEKLNGTDIILLLDRVSAEYCKKYIPDDDNNLRDVREDWDFLFSILNEHRSRLERRAADDIEEYVSGKMDDAYICYSGTEKLQQYFDDPFQDKYLPYRQVLFLKENLKDKPEDPLNALRHSENNLTKEIDLENKKFTLKYTSTTTEGVKIDVIVNGFKRPSGSKIRRKDDLAITWSKTYFETETKAGKVTELDNEFILVDSIIKTVHVKARVLKAKTKKITFNLKSWNRNPVNNGKIYCNSGADYKNIGLNNEIVFEGEDLGKQWAVSARADQFFSEERIIDFAKDCPDESSTIDLNLNKHKLKIQVVAESKDGRQIDESSLRFSKREFIGKELNEIHTITISCAGYKETKFDYHPLENVIPQVVLQKKKNDSDQKFKNEYEASAGDHGTWVGRPKFKRYSQKRDGSDLKREIKPHAGYQFTYFKFEGDKLIAQYKKRKNPYESPKLIAGSIVGLIVIGFSIWALISIYGTDGKVVDQKLDFQVLKNYIEGDSLILQTLKNFKESYEDAPDEYLKSLDSAIVKRELIDSLNFSEIKKLQVYPAQQQFLNAVKKIDSSKYVAFKRKLLNISSSSLRDIADTINASLQSGKIEDEIKQDFTHQVKKTSEGSQKNVETPIITPNAIDSEFLQELNGDDVTMAELDEWKADAEKKRYLNSIKLYEKFWESIKPNMQKDVLEGILNKINKDPNFNESELKKFLTKVCKTDESFSNYNNTPGKKSCKTLKELKEKVKL